MELDMSDVKPSLLSWVLVGLMAMSFIVFAKFVVNRWPNPATAFVAEFVNAA